MKNITRRFLQMALLSGLALCISSPKICAKEGGKGTGANQIKIISPIDGDMLNEKDGTITGGSLVTKMKIEAPEGKKILINGVRATYHDGVYQADLKLKNYENTIKIDAGGGLKQNIKVYWLKNYVGKYRFSIDDNIWFLKDININKDKYKSIFENPYLALLKKIHDTYGTKIHLNLFYQTEGFNLSQMTDQYKDEWKANAEWLGLSFHAFSEFPDKPYIKSSYEKCAKDCDLVKAEIKRFAGEEVMGTETTLHWGEGTVEACRALRDRGYTALAGYFNVDDNAAPVSYYLTPDQRRHLKSRFIWRDNKEGIIFGRIALVVNTVNLDEIVPYLDNVKKNYNPQYIDLMIHEQYFYPHYAHYQPDFGDKMMTAVKWAVDNGFKPGFLKEAVFE